MALCEYYVIARRISQELVKITHARRGAELKDELLQASSFDLTRP